MGTFHNHHFTTINRQAYPRRTSGSSQNSTSVGRLRVTVLVRCVRFVDGEGAHVVGTWIVS